MRKLIVIPTLHDPKEMHSTHEVQPKVSSPWNKLQEVKNVIWDSIDTAILQQSAEIPHWKVFAEGVLTFTPHPPLLFLYQEAKKQTEETTRGESRQDTLLTSLWFAGATFIPTDDPVAYQKSFAAWNAYQELDKQMSALSIDQPMSEDAQLKTEELLGKITKLSEERDQHISTIIDTHLEENDTGVLLFGIFQNAVQFLPSSIETSFISQETKEFWNLLHDPTIDSLYDAADKFLMLRNKRIKYM